MATPSVPPISITALETKKLKRLYFDFRITQVFSILCLLIFIFLMIFAAYMRIKLHVAVEQDTDQIGMERLVAPTLAFTGIFYLLAAMGCTKRRTWGRILGILAALILLPVGILPGALALFALLRSSELFGPRRVNSDDLIAEYKRRKKTPAAQR